MYMNTKNLGKLTNQFFLSPTTKSIIHNKYLLWTIFGLSLFNLYYKMIAGNLMFLVRFLLIGFVASFFSRNMMVILFLALAFTNLLEHGMHSISEGVENMDETEDAEKDAAEKDTTKKDTAKKVDTKKKESEKESRKTSLVEEKKKSDAAQDGIEDLTNSAEELLKIQKEVLENFDNIEPKMVRAETLIGKMNKVAEQMQNIRG